MFEAPEDREIVLRTRRRDECFEARLVLTAVGISAEAVAHDGWWWLLVDRDDLSRSTGELEAYRQENPEPAVRAEPPIPIYGGAALGVMGYWVTILVIWILAWQSAYGYDWLAGGAMQAGKVMAGQWWRTITALTLHVDAEHIAGNLLFGALFGYLAGQVLGGGVAWLAMLLAGGLGNFMNAIFQTDDHLSIGASTAVFAALGVIVAHALRSPATTRNGQPIPREKPLKRWSPLVGGIMLLAFVGVGDERTDVVAHVTGFVAGLLVGWVGCRLPSRWLANSALQKLAGCIALGMVLGAWIVGLAMAKE